MVQERAGPTLTICPACQVLAGPAAMRSSCWPCALVTSVRAPAMPSWGRGEPWASPPLHASHRPVSPCSAPWDHPWGCPRHRAAGDCHHCGSCLCPPPDTATVPGGGPGGPVEPHCAAVSALILALSSSWAGVILVRPGLAVLPASRNSAVPMQLLMPTTSTPARWRWTEGTGSRALGRSQEGGGWGACDLQRASQYHLLLREQQ